MIYLKRAEIRSNNKREERNENYYGNLALTDSAIENDSLMSLNEFKLSIPKKYARGESTKRIKYNEVDKVPHYELFVEPQVGSSLNRRGTDVYFKLPKSGRLVRIIIYPDWGVEFDPKFHKYIIRETDELDRRIIIGFCMKYQSTLRDACYPDNKEGGEISDTRKMLIQMDAADYRASDMPKRLKTGRLGTDFTNFYKLHGWLEPYDECGMFSEVAFI